VNQNSYLSIRESEGSIYSGVNYQNLGQSILCVYFIDLSDYVKKGSGRLDSTVRVLLV
jgi:hypothetical protein